MSSTRRIGSMHSTWVGSAVTDPPVRARGVARRPRRIFRNEGGPMSEPIPGAGAGAPKTVIVESAGGAYLQRIAAGRHVLPADEPVTAGGSDAGPTPYDLLLSALGACVSMTLGVYARRKRWPLEGVRVRLR